MKNQKRFLEYKELRKEVAQKYAAQSVGISQTTASHYDKFDTYAAYTKWMSEKNRMQLAKKHENYMDKLDKAYIKWCGDQSKENKNAIEKIIFATTKTVSWRFAPKVPSWMRRISGGK